MKKVFFSFASLVLMTWLNSCNDSSNNSTTGSDSSTNSSNAANTGAGDSSNNAGKGSSAGTSSATTTPSANLNAKPLSKDDSSFVIEAAGGGMMEVQAGQMAQQKATNERVKSFGAMMVQDHSQANDELKSLASGRGITLPGSLPAAEQKHIDQMTKLSGKAFDQHYVDMMVNDHKKDVAKFKQESTSAKDDQLKAWAAKTLPVLQKHLDSIQAIKKSKM
ncbi:MAG: DUF4142 domain-containing protein [Flavisolibacter sp.]|jgi:putative membrane protein